MENHVILKRFTKFIFLLFISFISCKEINNEVQIEDPNSTVINYSEINFESIYELKYDSSIEQWINYFELNEFIQQLNSNDFSSVIDNKKFLSRWRSH